MKKTLFLLSVAALLATSMNGCSASPTPASEQSTAPPTEPKQADITPELSDLLSRLHWFGQASFRLDGPSTIYFDPVVNFKEDPVPAETILISHAHSDHYDAKTLKQIISAETVIITTRAIADMLTKDGVPGEVRTLQAGDSITLGEVKIEAVPAYNTDKKYHPKEAGNLGFILTVRGVRLYFAGDTDVIPEMADFHPDIALIPIGGTYTMDPEQAVEAVGVLQPQVTVPMHALKESNLTAFQKLCDCNLYVMEVEQ